MMPIPVIQIPPPKPTTAPERKKSANPSAKRDDVSGGAFDDALSQARKSHARQGRGERTSADGEKKPAKSSKASKKQAALSQQKGAAKNDAVEGNEAVAGPKESASADQEHDSSIEPATNPAEDEATADDPT